MRIAVMLFCWFAFALSAARAGDPLPDGAVMRLGDMRWRFAEHSSEPKRYAWLPDSSGIVACGKETIRLFDAKTGRVIRDWKGDRGDCYMSVAVSPDGKTLAATKGRRVYFWDIASGKDIEIVEIRSRTKLDQIAFSPDGKKFAVGLLSGNAFEPKFAVQLWDIAKWKLLREWPSQSQIECLGFRPDTNTVFSLTKDRLLQWREDSDKPSSQLVLDFGSPRCVSRSGSIVAMNSIAMKGLTLWNATTGNEIGKLDGLDLRGSDNLCFSEDEKFLCIVSWRPPEEHVTVAVWDVQRRKPVRQFDVPYKARGVPLPSPDGRSVAMLANQCALNLFDVATGVGFGGTRGQQNPTQSGVFSSDSRNLLSITVEGDPFLWDCTTGKVIKQIRLDSQPALAAISNPSERAFIVGGWRGTNIRVIDERNGTELRRLMVGEDDAFVLDLHLVLNSQLVGRLRYASGEQSRLVRWDLRHGQRLQCTDLVDDSGPCQFSAAGQIRFGFSAQKEKEPLIFGVRDPRIDLAVWETFRGQLIWRRSVKGNTETTVTASPNGQKAVTASTEEVIGDLIGRGPSYLQVWELATGNERVRIERPTSTMTDGFGQPLFSPNGRVVVVPWAERTLLFYDALTGKELGQLKHDVGLKPLAFTPDGKRLATGVDDGTILIWEVGKFAFNTRTRHLAPGEIEMSWRDLAGEIRPAVEAMARLEESPAQALALFRERLKPAEPISPEKIQALIKNLQDRSYAKREAATRELLRFGEQAHPALRAAYEGNSSAEARKRIEGLLSEPALVRSPEVRRHLRAIELTAAIATPEAKAILSEWTKGDPAARETKAAQEALERLSP